MAKAAATPNIAPITVEPYHAPEREGVYDAHVQALLDAEPNYAEGEYPSVPVIVPNGDKNAKGEYIEKAKHVRYFQDSAKRHDRTARIVEDRDNGDGSSTVRFILKSKITRARKPVEVETATEPETEAA